MIHQPQPLAPNVKRYMQGHLPFFCEFIREKCVAHPTSKIQASEMCEHYNRWAISQWEAGRKSVQPTNPIAFGRMVKPAGLDTRIIRGKTYIVGIEVF